METTINEMKPIQEAKPVRQREVFLDFFRAVCLLFVMLGHRTILPPGIGVFVLPGFFIASGYTYRANQGDFKSFFVKRVKRLLVPFWIAMIIMGLVELIRAPMLGYGDATILVPNAITAVYGSFRNFPLIGSLGEFLQSTVPYKPKGETLDLILSTDCHLWFLPALFSADMVLYGYFKLRKERNWLDPIAITVFLFLAGLETIPNFMQLPYGLGRGFFAAALMIAGFWMKKTNLFTRANWKAQLALLALAIAPSAFSVVARYDGTGIVRSFYGEPMFLGVYITYLCGLSFAYAVMIALFWISQVPDNPISRFLAFAGRNSMDVYLWHMLAYFLGDLFMIQVVKATPHPDAFFMELFEGTELLYRWLIVFISYGALLGYSYLKGRVASAIKSKKAKAA